MRSWLSRSSAAAHVTVAVSGFMQKDHLPCAVGAAVRGQANEPGDPRNRRASLPKVLEASPSASGKAYKQVASYACMPRTGEAWTEAGMHACPAPQPTALARLGVQCSRANSQECTAWFAAAGTCAARHTAKELVQPADHVILP